jgi:hypothetical protein
MRASNRLLLGLVAALGLALPAPAPALGAPQPTRWCGNDVQAGDRQPDAVSGFQFHVVYAFPADGGDRFAEAALPIARDLAAIDEWWRGQDASRTPRFDLFSFPGCDTAFGNLDISRVQLRRPAGSYNGRVGFGALLDDVASVANDPDKKYVLFYDGVVEEVQVCGRSPSNALAGGAEGIAVVYLRSLCEALGTGGELAITAVHEMIHNLGALPVGAPHPCPGDRGHPCDSQADILAQATHGGEVLGEKQLDVGRDDYYGHGGAQWDVQDSPWLEQLLSPDRTPPAGPPSVTATSRDARVTVSWAAATDDAGTVRYRVYRDGRFLQETQATSFSQAAGDGQTFEYVVRARDAVNHLGPRQTIRFRVGLGIVDEQGRLVRDTVAPGPVRSLRGRRARGRLTLSWTAALDRGGLRSYRVTRNGRRVAFTARRTLTVAASRSRGLWAVRAVDRAGNVGVAGATVRVP